MEEINEIILGTDHFYTLLVTTTLPFVPPENYTAPRPSPPPPPQKLYHPHAHPPPPNERKENPPSPQVINNDYSLKSEKIG